MEFLNYTFDLLSEKDIEITIIISIISLIISLNSSITTKNLAKEQMNIQLFQLRIEIIKVLQNMISFANVIRNLKLEYINDKFYNTILDKEMSLCDMMLSMCDQIFNTELANKEKRIDDYFDLIKNNISNLENSKYIFYDIYGFHDDIVELNDLMFKFLLAVIDIDSSEQIYDLELKKMEFCKKAEVIDVKYSKKLYKLMMIDFSLIKRIRFAMINFFKIK